VKPTLIIPVEIQVREFDSKLLLACVAAQRGFVSILGHRTQVDYGVASWRRGTYLSKSMTRRSSKMFRILRLLGHEIAVWDEEALVYPSAEHYFRRRISTKALASVSVLFAWGQDNAEMFRKYPDYDGTPIHVTGHPRIDLLRPELRGFFGEDVRRIRERHGRFVLVNTNFSKVNGFRHRLDPSEPVRAGAGTVTANGLSTGYLAHKRALFDAFRAMLPALGEAFPERTFIVRPHPNERPDPWVAAATARDNVQVVHDGNVIPWLLASDVLVHNGCTTAIEAHALDRPVVAYQPVKSDPYDSDLPNSLSHESANLDELCGILARSASGELECAPSPSTPRPFAEYLASLTGSLASDRIIDVLESRAAERDGLPQPSIGDALRGRYAAMRRRLTKQSSRTPKLRRSGLRERQLGRFPGISIEDLRERIARLDRSLGRFGDIRAERIAEHVFRISA